MGLNKIFIVIITIIKCLCFEMKISSNFFLLLFFFLIRKIRCYKLFSHPIILKKYIYFLKGYSIPNGAMKNVEVIKKYLSHIKGMK